mgnify:CR=1 FL=1
MKNKVTVIHTVWEEEPSGEIFYKYEMTEEEGKIWMETNFRSK